MIKKLKGKDVDTPLREIAKAKKWMASKEQEHDITRAELGVSAEQFHKEQKQFNIQLYKDYIASGSTVRTIQRKWPSLPESEIIRRINAGRTERFSGSGDRFKGYKEYEKWDKQRTDALQTSPPYGKAFYKDMPVDYNKETKAFSPKRKPEPKPETCMICKLDIKDQDDQELCPECENFFHYAHLSEWLKVKGTCPVCKKKIELTDKTPVLTMDRRTVLAEIRDNEDGEEVSKIKAAIQRATPENSMILRDNTEIDYIEVGRSDESLTQVIYEILDGDNWYAMHGIVRMLKRRNYNWPTRRTIRASVQSLMEDGRVEARRGPNNGIHSEEYRSTREGVQIEVIEPKTTTYVPRHGSNPLEMTMNLETFRKMQEPNPVRRARTEEDYLGLITGKAMTAEAMAAEFGIALSTVKWKLKKLYDQGKLERRMLGSMVFYGAK